MRNLEKVSVGALKIGMYVAELDRPWLGTPFLFQGFYLRTAEQIHEVQRLCQHVFVDAKRCAENRQPTVAPERERLSVRPIGRSNAVISLAAAGGPKVVYPERVSVEAEVPVARQLRAESRRVVDSLFREARIGRSVDSQTAREVVCEMVDSVVRNPHALVCLSLLKDKDEYTAIHSLNVCTLSLVFGHHLGMSLDELRELGLGALLHDIGKVQVPLEILNKPANLTPEEFEVVKGHPGAGREILSSRGGLTDDIISIAHSHHERLDGGGYPRGLTRHDITLFGRIVAITDMYDALTSDRVYRAGCSPLQAMTMLYDLRGTHFEDGLVEQFINCFGIYPVGTLVEMSTDEVALVLSINRSQRLRPKILVVLDAAKRFYSSPRIIDLAEQGTAHDGQPLRIRNVLKAGAHGFDIRQVLPLFAALHEPGANAWGAA